MKRRNFLVGIGGSAVGGSALIGSGAFSRVESGRAVGITVAEDPDGYLSLDRCDSPNGSYVDIDDDGHLRILMNPDNPAADDTYLGDGVNSNSTSVFDRMFRICNQGTSEACVWIADRDDWPVVDEGEHEGERRVEFFLEGAPESTIVGEESGVVLDVGECVCVGIEIRTYGLEEGDTLLDDSITINADADGA